jgi:hypothetical protein
MLGRRETIMKMAVGRRIRRMWGEWSRLSIASSGGLLVYTVFSLAVLLPEQHLTSFRTLRLLSEILQLSINLMYSG